MMTKTEIELNDTLSDLVLQVDLLFEKIEPSLLAENPELISAHQESRTVLRKYEARRLEAKKGTG